MDFNTIQISFKSGETVTWDGSKNQEWDDDSFDGTAFIVKRHGAWVGIYNFDVIATIFVG